MSTASLARVLCAAALAFAAAPAAATAAQPRIITSDVRLFYQVYDAAGGHPTAEQLQHDYLDRGSDGLHTFARLRNITGKRIAAEIAKDPALYANARRCMAILPRGRERLMVAMRKLAELYPAAKFPPVTVAVSRGKPVGVGGPVTGVMIGLEALCGVTYFDPDMEDRFVHVLLHEYLHVQQSPALAEDDHPTVLESSLIEGAAEFMTELIAGGVAEPGIRSEVKGHETEIETAFVADEDKTDLRKWLYNGSMTKAGDLGYWVGYRIVKAYYERASDKRQAIHDILGMTDPKAFLARSGWHPGIVLDRK
ncbi:MAG TPA: DUF2268 domain-containing putative Zn-dependent protease [Sphingomicrobium sp.]|nr:DUF2268 domain-containing putative Zn-dependent protease [Sphingomicrobium sp.]